MEYLIGLLLCVAVAGFATAIGLDRERGFYPPVLIVIASYYVLFAVMGASRRTLVIRDRGGECVSGGCCTRLQEEPLVRGRCHHWPRSF